MQIGFPTSPTRDGTWWAGVAVKDHDAMDDEKDRLHEINEAWYAVPENCDDECRTAGVEDCIESAIAGLNNNDAFTLRTIMLDEKAYCKEHNYEWAPYALSYINYELIVVDEDGNVVEVKDDKERMIYQDWPNNYGWGPNARADVWGTDFFSEGKDVVNFLATPGQMHIHTPSEHQFNGKNYDAEIHWVHYTMVDGAPNFSVIGFMFDIDDGDAAGNTTLIDELLKTYNSQSPD